MLMLSGVCIAVAFCGIFTSMSRLRKWSLFMMGINGFILLTADRFAYIFRGDTSTFGFWMVRICNFLVFFMSLVIVHTFNMYLTDLCRTDVKLLETPLRLRVNEVLLFIGELLIIVSQFTGFYYTFDATNHYHRASGFIICYLIPMSIWIMQFSVIVQFCRKIDKLLYISLILFTILPFIASVMQFFIYGLSLTNITLVGLILVLRIFEVRNTSQQIGIINRREKQHLRSMVEETAYALAEAIEAKDKYTHGHSSRVAKYSEMIARQVGKDERECQNIYLVALLHDVGKIGISEQIINKDSRLNDEEFAVIKTHPVIGYQILKKITHNPTLSIGAHYHHERYDGKGYPEGLKGEEIPEIARIIAVADAYDAMTSKRSYRDSLPQQVVKEEIRKGTGTQFDPVFARVMLHLIEQDTEYSMREKTPEENVSVTDT
ncbi:MAG: HD-GYP domain-containing protein [Oscillospiraceae bacterium]|nr:HD-GYP domain-containing protein [Oscillospiraceae bacterium]